jgi:hypothetical protein
MQAIFLSSPPFGYVYTYAVTPETLLADRGDCMPQAQSCVGGPTAVVETNTALRWSVAGSTDDGPFGCAVPEYIEGQGRR